MKSSLCLALTSLLLALAVSCVTTDEPEGTPVDRDVAAVDDLELSPEDEAALDTFGQQCGPVVCTGKTHCCNASCGRCVPLGVECPQEACLAGEADEDADRVTETESVFEPIGQQCGPTVCGGTTPKCCNAACGICVPQGAECTQEHTC
jgi:hypothetical protein